MVSWLTFGTTVQATRSNTNVAEETSRHYNRHHPGMAADYDECRVITRAAALAFAGQRKVAKAEEKNGRSPESATSKAPRDPFRFPSAAQQAALQAALSGAGPAAPAAPLLLPPPPAPPAPTAATNTNTNTNTNTADPPVANPAQSVSAYNAHFNSEGERIVWPDDDDDEMTG